jgi:hypothetical protein
MATWVDDNKETVMGLPVIRWERNFLQANLSVPIPSTSSLAIWRLLTILCEQCSELRTIRSEMQNWC